MRKLTFIVVMLIGLIPTAAQVGKPDFAYPKTVMDNAESLLKKAIDQNDGIAKTEALIQLSIAESTIDPDKLKRAILRVEDVIVSENDHAIKAILQALDAQLYYRVYTMEKWKYDERSLPLEPYPEDISEWSGDQFKKRISDLCKMSTDGLTAYKEFPISGYSRIITADSYTRTYFPTLADFLAINAISLVYDQTESADYQKETIIGARDCHEATSAAWYNWQIMHTVSGEGDTFDNLKKLYEATYSSPYSSLLLSYIGSNRITDRDDIIKRKWLVDNIRDNIARFPQSQEKPTLEYYLHIYMKRLVDIDYPDMVPAGTEFDVKTSVCNASRYSLRVYKVTEYQANNWKVLQKLAYSQMPLYREIPIESSISAPFRTDTIVPVKIDDPGYYVIAPCIEGKALPNVKAVLWCVPIYSVGVSGCSDAYAIAVDPTTGKPMKGVDVSLVKDGDATPLGRTDKNGMLRFGFPKKNASNRSRSGYLRYTFKGVVYDLDDNNVYFAQRDASGDVNAYSASIMTDRAIYRPGDEMMWTGVVSCRHSDVSSLSDNTRIKVVLKNVNGKEVCDTICETDGFGRISGAFMVPDDGLTGEFRLIAYLTMSDDSNEQIGQKWITISDYRMPEFEVKITSVNRNYPSNGDVTIKGNLSTYSGMPLADADVTAALWTAYRYRWFSPSRQIHELSVKTDGQGDFEVIFSDSVFKSDNGKDKYFIAKITGTSATGETASAQSPFSLGKPMEIVLNLDNSNIDVSKSVNLDIKAYDAESKAMDIPMIWSIKDKSDTLIASGSLSDVMDWSDIAPDKYKLTISPVDTLLADDITSEITVYNPATSSVPGAEPLFVPESNYRYRSDGKVEIMYGSTRDDCSVYYSLCSGTDLLETKLIDVDKGYHYIEISLPEGIDNAAVDIFTVKNCHTYIERINLSRVENNVLDIKCESFRDKLVPSSEETWRFSIRNPGENATQAAMILDMYNKSLDALSSHSMNMSFGDARVYPNMSVIYNYPDSNCSYVSMADPEYMADINDLTSLLSPVLNSYGRGFFSVSDPYFIIWEYLGNQPELAEVLMTAASGVQRRLYGARSATNYKMESADLCEEEVALDSAEAEDSVSAMNEDTAFEFRDSETPVALWRPMLTTDEYGNLDVTFTVPNANATWRLLAVAWSRDMKTGSMIRDFIANKPVMVKPNLPRFLRSGDKAQVLARVMNNSDSVATITSVIELFDPISGKVTATETFVNPIEANGSENISILITVPNDMSAIGYRVRSGNGTFSDGEQAIIRVLPSISQVTETRPFYLNTGETEYITDLPSYPDARLSLTFTENPAWTIVSALPGLRSDMREDANSAAAALFSAAVARGIIKENPDIADALLQWRSNPSDSALISMLQRNEDLKIAMLNATSWVQAAESDNERMSRLSILFDSNETGKAISRAVATLKKLQRPDGGWAWGAWSDNSSMWVTANVIDMMGELNRLGYLPKDNDLDGMIKKALQYYDKKVRDTDLTYTVIRSKFPAVAQSSNGRNVTARTIQYIIRDWKKFSPVTKSIAAIALNGNKYPTMARQLIESIRQFGVSSPTQGLTYPSVNSIAGYTVILEAFAMIEPGSSEVDGLRQQLIVRKQGEDWGSAVVSTQVIASILSTGTKWTVPAQGAVISAGDNVIKPASIEKATGSLRVDLSDMQGEKLTISTTGAGPAYGAIYQQFSQSMDKVGAYATEDLSIEKNFYVKRDGKWADVDSLKMGDRVKVQLTIKSKRALDYVTIVDERSAAFEPVDQIPGWMWSEGVGFYRENRDNVTNLFVSSMPSGTYLLTYEMTVNLAGSFSSGIATIQSQYAPEISAHSAGMTLDIK